MASITIIEEETEKKKEQKTLTYLPGFPVHGRRSRVLYEVDGIEIDPIEAPPLMHEAAKWAEYGIPGTGLASNVATSATSPEVEQLLKVPRRKKFFGATSGTWNWISGNPKVFRVNFNHWELFEMETAPMSVGQAYMVLNEGVEPEIHRRSKTWSWTIVSAGFYNDKYWILVQSGREPGQEWGSSVKLKPGKVIPHFTPYSNKPVLDWSFSYSRAIGLIGKPYYIPLKGLEFSSDDAKNKHELNTRAHHERLNKRHLFGCHRPYTGIHGNRPVTLNEALQCPDLVFGAIFGGFAIYNSSCEVLSLLSEVYPGNFSCGSSMTLQGGPGMTTKGHLAIAQVDSNTILDLVDTALGNLTIAHTFTPRYKEIDVPLADSIFREAATILREAGRVPKSSLKQRLRSRAEISCKLMRGYNRKFERTISSMASCINEEKLRETAMDLICDFTLEENLSRDTIEGRYLGTNIEIETVSNNKLVVQWNEMLSLVEWVAEGVIRKFTGLDISKGEKFFRIPMASVRDRKDADYILMRTLLAQVPSSVAQGMDCLWFSFGNRGNQTVFAKPPKLKNLVFFGAVLRDTPNGPMLRLGTKSDLLVMTGSGHVSTMESHRMGGAARGLPDLSNREVCARRSQKLSEREVKLVRAFSLAVDVLSTREMVHHSMVIDNNTEMFDFANKLSIACEERFLSPGVIAYNLHKTMPDDVIELLNLPCIPQVCHRILSGSVTNRVSRLDIGQESAVCYVLKQRDVLRLEVDQ